MSTPSTGPALPFASAPSASVAGRSLADSRHQWRREPSRLAENPPHIVVLMSDDAGFSAPECFGGPVHMPTMQRLADRGVRFNRFHTTAICSPTRAALLTGRNHHAVGFGQISEFASDFDGYVGEIPRSAATIALVLSAYGYDTGAFGKWHNTPTTQVTTKGPFDLWPTGLGFRYFYGFMAGHRSTSPPGCRAPSTRSCSTTPTAGRPPASTTTSSTAMPTPGCGRGSSGQLAPSTRALMQSDPRMHGDGRSPRSPPGDVTPMPC